MGDSTEYVTFGRRHVSQEPAAALRYAATTDTPERLHSSNPILEVLDGLFLWLPNERSPGLPAIGLVLLRQATLPLVLMIAPFVALLFVSAANGKLVSHNPSVPNWAVSTIAPYAFGCIVVVQELARYSFIRRAEYPIRSISLFTAFHLGFIILVFNTNLYTCSWMITAQVIASAAMVAGLRFRTHIVAILAGIMVCQTALNVTAPGLLVHGKAVRYRAAEPRFRLPVVAETAAETEAPAAGDMKTWAKIYPGATNVRSTPVHLLGHTDWRVRYNVDASPEEIAAFYQDIALRNGFDDVSTFARLHIFRQKSTGSYFAYMIYKIASRTQVYFHARTLDR